MQSEIPLPRLRDRNDISWFPNARQQTDTRDCHGIGSPPPKEEGQGVVAQPSTTPDPSLSKEGNHAAIFIQPSQPNDHAICA